MDSRSPIEAFEDKLVGNDTHEHVASSENLSEFLI